MATQNRPSPMSERLDRFRQQSPAAGTPFPEITAQLLDGGSWSPAEAAGRAFVLEVGSFT